MVYLLVLLQNKRTQTDTEAIIGYNIIEHYSSRGCEDGAECNPNVDAWIHHTVSNLGLTCNINALE